ncbi:class E sortase [Nocardioides sp. Iso805N]|uniref:class E sortase n=1 Tax=Nocardioides sp. Iso805N TaxID=1283287 RepID=UPI00035D682E|nr:class E sortase [Nocardioides sp. Iso805N]
MSDTTTKSRATDRRAASPARPRRQVRPGEAEETLEVFSSALTVVAIVCVWMLLQLLVLGGFSQARSQHLLYAQFRSELAQATAPTGAVDYNGKTVERGAPVAVISIPRLGLEQVVVQGSTSRELVDGPGHLPSTPLPGQQGVSVVLGRASTYGAPFKAIDTLKVGDAITVQNAEAKVAYRVIGIRRAGDPIPPAPTGTQGRLTLVTAGGSGFLSGIRPRDAVYVDATTGKATGVGQVATSLPADQAMAKDTSVLPALSLYLALLIALVLGVSVARRRLRGSLVWLCAVPIAIALAWVTTDQVVALLPNLM